jgi:PadR family transcriptional regulator AphA
VAGLSLADYAVLGLFAEAPTHGFAVARNLADEGEVGRVITIRRPQVYRALQHLQELGFIEVIRTEPGESGPHRQINRATASGRSVLEEWLGMPVDHVRDLRTGFLVKVTLIERSNRSPVSLIDRQREHLRTTLEALIKADEKDVVSLWRRANAAAADRFLQELRSTSLAGARR